jgi:hypothetical protein
MIIEPKDTNFYSTDPVKMQMYGDLLQAQKEIERLNKKIQKLIDAGDVMYTLLDPPSISMRTTEYDNALQGWDDAKTKY